MKSFQEFLKENSLYQNKEEQAALIADKKKLLDAFYINFFGFLGLFNINPKASTIRKWFASEGKITGNVLEDVDSYTDVIASFSALKEANIIPQFVIHSLTVLMTKIKNRSITTIEINEVKALLKELKYSTTGKPDTKVFTILDDFVNGTTTLNDLAKQFFALSKTSAFKEVSLGFRDMVLKGQFVQEFNKLQGEQDTDEGEYEEHQSDEQVLHNTVVDLFKVSDYRDMSLVDDVFNQFEPEQVKAEIYKYSLLPKTNISKSVLNIIIGQSRQDKAKYTAPFVAARLSIGANVWAKIDGAAPVFAYALDSKSPNEYTNAVADYLSTMFAKIPHTQTEFKPILPMFIKSGSFYAFGESELGIRLGDELIENVFKIEDAEDIIDILNSVYNTPAKLRKIDIKKYFAMTSDVVKTSKVFLDFILKNWGIDLGGSPDAKILKDVSEKRPNYAPVDMNSFKADIASEVTKGKKSLSDLQVIALSKYVRTNKLEEIYYSLIDTLTPQSFSIIREWLSGSDFTDGVSRQVPVLYSYFVDLDTSTEDRKVIAEYINRNLARNDTVQIRAFAYRLFKDYFDNAENLLGLFPKIFDAPFIRDVIMNMRDLSAIEMLEITDSIMREFPYTFDFSLDALLEVGGRYMSDGNSTWGREFVSVALLAMKHGLISFQDIIPSYVIKPSQEFKKSGAYFRIVFSVIDKLEHIPNRGVISALQGMYNPEYGSRGGFDNIGSYVYLLADHPSFIAALPPPYQDKLLDRMAGFILTDDDGLFPYIFGEFVEALGDAAKPKLLELITGVLSSGETLTKKTKDKIEAFVQLTYYDRVFKQLQLSEVKPYQAKLGTDVLRGLLLRNKLPLPDFGDTRTLEGFKSALAIEPTITELLTIKETQQTPAQKKKSQKNLASTANTIHAENGYPLILKEYDVNIPLQADLTKRFLEMYPDTDILEPMYHGTSDIGASMILRYGFTRSRVGDFGYTGLMMGAGIYLAKTISKSLLYIGTGYKGATQGYIFECRAFLGDLDPAVGATAKVADFGYNEAEQTNLEGLRANEWVVRDGAYQIKIVKCYEVRSVTKAEYQENLKRTLTESHLEEDEMDIKTLLHEATGDSTVPVTFIFWDNKLPTPDGKYIPFDKAPLNKFNKFVKHNLGSRGYEVRFDVTRAIYNQYRLAGVLNIASNLEADEDCYNFFKKYSGIM